MPRKVDDICIYRSCAFAVKCDKYGAARRCSIGMRASIGSGPCSGYTPKPRTRSRPAWYKR